MLRELVIVGRQTAAGQSFTGTLNDAPRVGTYWEVQRITLVIPSYTTGRVTASVFVAGRFVCGTNQGQNDSSSGAPFRVNASEVVTVVWSTTNTPTLVSGTATLYVDQQEVRARRA